MSKLSPKAQLRAQRLGYSHQEVMRVARLARPITDNWWTHRYENLLFRKGDHEIHDFEQEGESRRQDTVPRHLLISARDSITDLLIDSTPKPQAENARWVLKEIEKELQK